MVNSQVAVLPSLWNFYKVKTDLKNIETERNRFFTIWKRSKTMQKRMKTVKNDAKTAEIQFKIRQDTSEGADSLYTY